MPGPVPKATLIAPVDGFKLIPRGQVPLCAIVELVNVLGTPFVLSFARTFAMAMPPNLELTVPFSDAGSIKDVIFIVSIIVSQFVGVNLSQSR